MRWFGKILSVIVAIVLFIGILLGSDASHSAAQEDGLPTPTPPVVGNMLVHVVQRGETLFRIAQLYGSSVDEIMLINGINDVRFITTGQRLLIPDAQQHQPGINMRHEVAVGETLYSIAAAYDVPVGILVELNDVAHSERLYSGQSVVIGAVSVTQTPVGHYVVQAGDYLLSVAVRLGVRLTDLQAANGLLTGEPIFAGQILKIPSEIAGGAVVMWPSPIQDLKVSPAVPKQGQAISLQLLTDGLIQGEGVFMERPFRLEKTTAEGEDYRYGAVLSVHAFAEAGVYPLRLTLSDIDGRRVAYEIRIQVLGGGYDSEAIDIPENRESLLAPELVQTELERVIAVMGGFTPLRYFGGWMSLPSTGIVTSQFGTRRSYNGSPYNTFHGGTDFGGAEGSPIVAPSAGVVVMAEALQVRGNVVILDHGWGVYTGYWHLSDRYVNVGQVVSKGDVIGALGSTGLVTGAHLHWELWVGGVQVDPMQWVQQAFP